MAKSGKISHCFEKVPEMDPEGEKSATKMIGGFPWRLRMFGGHNPRLFIECLESENSSVWHCNFSYKIKFHDVSYGANVEENNEETVTMCRTQIESEGLEKYMRYNFILDGDEDEIVDFVKVDVSITVKEPKKNRFRPKPTIDIYTPNEEMYDCELTIGDKKIQVNKQYLAFHSVFFKDLFFGKKDDDKKEAKVDGVTPEDFALLLAYLYRVEKKITFENYKTLARMALQFQMQNVKDAVECFLMANCGMDSGAMSEGEKLLVAEKYGLETYKEVTVEQLYSDTMEYLKESEEYEEFSERLKERIKKKEEEINKKEEEEKIRMEKARKMREELKRKKEMEKDEK